MKCPLKKMIMLKDRSDLCITGKEMPSQIKIDFGECDLRNCMAYNSSLGKCAMIEGNKKI